jgi:hypothetical protein
MCDKIDGIESSILTLINDSDDRPYWLTILKLDKIILDGF